MSVEIISQAINESFIEFKEKLTPETVSYLTGLISESDSLEEMRSSIESALIDFEVIDVVNVQVENSKIVDQLVSALRKKGALSFSTTPKVKSHLVCEINPNAEPKLNDPNLTMEDYLKLTRSSDPKVRVQVLRTMCPCKVRSDVELLWSRIMEMAKDEDPRVRYQVVHDLCDGSPNWREESVISTLESMHNDVDPKVRNTVHKVLTNYKFTGKWNIL